MNRRNRSFIFGVLLASLAATAYGSSSGQKDTSVTDDSTLKNAEQSRFVQAIKERGYVRVGISEAAPQQHLDPSTGNWVGVFPEFLSSWAKSLGVTVEYTNTTFAAMVVGVQSGIYDVAPDLTATDERRKAVNFTEPMLEEFGMYYVKKNPNLDSTEYYQHLNQSDKTICSVVGSPYQLVIDAGKLKLNAKILKLPDYQSCNAALLAGRVVAVLYASSTAVPFIQANPSYALLAPPKPLAVKPVTFAVSKEWTDKDLAPLNNAISKWKSSPDGMEAAHKRWGVVSPEPYMIKPVPSWASKVLGEMKLAPPKE
ncbi:MAG: transporter substrate-binding domain-containing protein [Alcaligenaceae bacterium]|nr:transporter substrate-binding domain-containing protein [Alcaligenaceae bacterium]